MIAWGFRIHVPSSKRNEVHRIVRSVLGPTRVRGGCVSCRAYQEIEDPDVLCLVQEWASTEALERYLRSQDRQTLVSVMELATERPEIWFDTIATREGLDRLATLMGSDLNQSR
jgi:quinol monooxygenase YgiN